MGLSQRDLVAYFDQLLKSSQWPDYAPNGLQVEGTEKIQKICFAVSADQVTLDLAVLAKAQALVVHHGLLWNHGGATPLTGAHGQRIRTLIENKINLLAYHLPLDAHPEVGNAVALGSRLELQEMLPFGDYRGKPLGVWGKWAAPLKVQTFCERLENVLKHPVLSALPKGVDTLTTLGIITGGASSEWKLAQRMGLSAYLTGEMKEYDYSLSHESGIAFFAGGHSATEQFGVQELMKRLQRDHQGLECTYLPSQNPA